MVAEKISLQFHFFSSGQLLVAESDIHRFDFFYKTVETIETLYCMHYHLNIRLSLVYSHVTNGRNWFTFDASPCALKTQIQRNSVQHRLWMGSVFFLSAVTISLAIVSCKFHYHLPWQKALFRQGNIDGSSSTSSRLKLTFYLPHADFGHP